MFNYSGRARSVVNNGHTLQVDVEPGSFIKIGDARFARMQFHFHSPSEHPIRGERFPLEGYLVHQNAEGHILQKQVDRFISRIGADARGVQPQNARIVVEH